MSKGYPTVIAFTCSQNIVDKLKDDSKLGLPIKSDQNKEVDAFMSELIGSAFIIFTYIYIKGNRSFPQEIKGLFIGSAVVINIICFLDISGGSFNPAFIWVINGILRIRYLFQNWYKCFVSFSWIENPKIKFRKIFEKKSSL